MIPASSNYEVDTRCDETFGCRLAGVRRKVELRRRYGDTISCVRIALIELGVARFGQGTRVWKKLVLEDHADRVCRDDSIHTAMAGLLMNDHEIR